MDWNREVWGVRERTCPFSAISNPKIQSSPEKSDPQGFTAPWTQEEWVINEVFYFLMDNVTSWIYPQNTCWYIQTHTSTHHVPRDRGQHAIVRGRLQPTVGTARLIPVAAESIGRGGHAANSLQQNPSEGHLRDQSPLIINCLRDNGP